MYLLPYFTQPELEHVEALEMPSKISELSLLRDPVHTVDISPWSTELYNLNFQSLEVVSRYRDPQPQVTENYLVSWNLIQNECQGLKFWDKFYFQQPV